MYYPDLSSYEYLRDEDSAALNVGWLDGAHKYLQSEPLDLFVERLWAFCHMPVNQMMGIHECELCPESIFDRHVWRGDTDLWLGSAEIRIFGLEGVIYAAPNLIYHYVVDHHYSPPDEFVGAVLKGPLPDSSDYVARARQFHWGRKAIRDKQ